MQRDKPAFGKGSRSRGRTTKGERTKRRLLAAAREVLAKQGYHGTRIEDIAQAAGVAKGTFYLYFKNKQTVTMAVMEEVFAEGVRAMLDARTEDDPFLEILEPNIAYARIVFSRSGILRAFVQFSQRHPEGAQLWSEVTRRWLARVEAVMDRRLGPGTTDPATRLLVVHAMSWMVDGVLLSFLVRHDPRLEEVVQSPEHLAETLSVLWYRAVYGEDPAPERLASGRKVLDFHFANGPGVRASD